MKRLMPFIKIIGVIFIIGFVYTLIPISHDNTTLYIPSKDIDSTIDALRDSGYSVTWADKLILDFSEIPDKGWYTIDTSNKNRVTFFRELHKLKTAKSMNIIIYAGETSRELLDRLSRDMKLSVDKLTSLYNQKSLYGEGDIFAMNYIIARDANEEETLGYLFAQSRTIKNRFIRKYFGDALSSEAYKKMLTIASIIQKESNTLSEMPMISAVIHNRLKKKMKLQIDSTLNYGEFSHTIITRSRIKNDTSLYNTYKHKGLPPEPLGTIVPNALYSAANPAKNDYLFFMLSPNGGHNFTADYKEHIVNIKKFREHQKRRREEKALAKLLAEKEDQNATSLEQ